MTMQRAILSTALFGALCMSLPALAQQSAGQCNQEREVEAGSLTERMYNDLNEVYEMIGEEEWQASYSRLEELLDRSERNTYTQAVIHQGLGHVMASQERMREALTHFERSVSLNELPNSQHFQLMLQIAQLYYIENDYRTSLTKLDEWLCAVPTEKSNRADAYELKASAHAELEEYRPALQAIERAIAISDDPKEQWYQLKLGMHFELKEMPEAAETLEILVQMSPNKKDYWIQLSGVYLELQNEARALSVLALANRKGLLDKESEYKQLSSLYQSEGVPYKAADILQGAIEAGGVENTKRHWEMVAGAWYEAHELDRALAAYERAGAQASDGEIDLQRSSILVDQERWSEARSALSRALNKGGLSDRQTGNAYLLLGMAEFNLNNFSAAREAFNEATNYGTIRQAAQEWLNHLDQQARKTNG